MVSGGDCLLCSSVFIRLLERLGDGPHRVCCAHFSTADQCLGDALLTQFRSASSGSCSATGGGSAVGASGGGS